MNHNKACMELAAARQEQRDLWLSRWPNHCKGCEGAGGHGFTEMHGFRHGSGEPMWDVCECLEHGNCPRCGTAAFNGEVDDALDRPCFNCGWSQGCDGFEAECSAPPPWDCPGCLEVTR